MAAEPQPLDLHRQPSALLEIHAEVVEILVGDDAVHGRAERDHLRLADGVVGLLLVDDRQASDPERAVVGDARARAHLHDLLTCRTGLGHMQHGLERVGVDRLDRFHHDAVGAVEENLRRVTEPLTAEHDLAVAAALHPAGEDRVEPWKRRLDHRGHEDGQPRCDHREAQHGADAARGQGKTPEPGGMCLRCDTQAVTHDARGHDDMGRQGKRTHEQGEVRRSAAGGPGRHRRSRSAGHRAPSVPSGH